MKNAWEHQNFDFFWYSLHPFLDSVLLAGQSGHTAIHLLLVTTLSYDIEDIHYNDSNGDVYYNGSFESYDRNRTRKRSVDNSFYSTEFFTIEFKISTEGIVSLALTQLPAVCLAILGIYKAFKKYGCSKLGIKDASR